MPVMFSNEFSLPYLTKVETVTTVCMARVIGELKSEINIPFGVNMLWDPYASLDLAAATGAKFIREIMSGVYASDYGLWDTDPGAIVRHQMKLGLKNVKLLWNIVPEAAKYLADRPIEQIAKTTVFNNKPDVICVSGITAGAAHGCRRAGPGEECDSHHRRLCQHRLQAGDNRKDSEHCRRCRCRHHLQEGRSV